MKMNKKILSLVLSAGLMVSSSITAYAATPADIISSLKNAGATSDQISKAQDYLAKTNVDAAKLDEVKAQVDSVSSLLKEKGFSDITKLGQADKLRIMGSVTMAANDLGLKASFSKGPDGKTYASLVDGSGTVIATFNNTKSTGASSGIQMQHTSTNYGNMLILGVLVLISGFAAMLFNRKKTVR